MRLREKKTKREKERERDRVRMALCEREERREIRGHSSISCTFFAIFNPLPPSDSGMSMTLWPLHSYPPISNKFFELHFLASSKEKKREKVFHLIFLP